MGDLDALFRLDGKVAVITGASSGLGASFAKALASAGAVVALGARREDKLADTVAAVEGIGGRAHAFRTDVTDPQDCHRLVEEAMDCFGRVDVLVNNAGVGTAVPATRETPEEFRSVVELNLSACYWMAQACAKVMGPGSSIVNISSVLGLASMGLPQAAYASSKAGLIGLTRDLAQQWTPRKGIRVNALAPGYFESEMTDQFAPEYLRDRVLPRVLMGRFGRHEEVAAALLFLASSASSYITGTVLPVEGGILAN